MKALNEDGLEHIDGRPVEDYEAKIVNAFAMETEDAVGISDGDLITFMVTVRAETPKFISNKKSGRIKRQNQFRVQDVVTMDPDKAKVLYDNLEMKVYGINDGLVEVSYIVKDEEKELGFNPADGAM